MEVINAPSPVKALRKDENLYEQGKWFFAHRQNDPVILMHKIQAKQQNTSTSFSTNAPSLSIAASLSVKSEMMGGANSTLSSQYRARVLNSLSMTGVAMVITLLFLTATSPMVRPSTLDLKQHEGEKASMCFSVMYQNQILFSFDVIIEKVSWIPKIVI